MRKLLHSSTRSQLLLSFGLLLTLVLAVLVIAVIGFSRLMGYKEELFDAAFTDVANVLRLDAGEHEARAAILMMMVSPPHERSEWNRRLQAVEMEQDRVLEELEERLSSRPELARTLDELMILRTEILDTRDNEVVPLVRQGEVQEAISISADGVQEGRFLQVQQLTAELVDAMRNRAVHVQSQSDRAARATILVFVIIGVFAVALATFLSFFVTSLIFRPLNDLASAAERISEGDLTIALPTTDRRDEIGTLSESFRKMLGSLREFTGEVHEGINVLAATASEILAATTQIATGVSETAASVNETTSTVEEARQTAKVVSEKASGVLEVSQRISRTSVDGRSKVDEAVNEMQVIKEHMENIGRNIMRLHEHNQAISDIITSVNDLAEQSNILAINAAIEAAKAGEHGKGFAVVAHEIKSLAVQSKQATGQVRSILGEVQQTANSTVMATERGNKVVESGVDRSRAAGEAIRLMADTVTAASQAAMQISASSNEQVVGMDQVASAMENITQASHQNAAGTKQAETSARNLHELGQRLKNLASRYRLS